MGVNMENFQLSYQVRGQLTGVPSIQFDYLIIYQLSDGGKGRLSEAQAHCMTTVSLYIIKWFISLA